MTQNPRLFASLILTAIAVFLVSYTWVPALQSLQREEGAVSHIAAQSNTWYAVEILTASGARLSCRTRRGWPLVGPDRCPLESFEQHLGQRVTVLHDGKRPYQVAAGNEMVMDYSSHRRAQLIAIALAGFMLTMAYWIWRRR